MVNELNPETLDANPRLFFHLQLQRLIELIRVDNVAGALDFAQDVLAPLGEDDPTLLPELEEVMALLAFRGLSDDVSPLAHLLSPEQRERTASELNAAILASQSQDDTPRLPTLFRLLAWCHRHLEGRVSQLPSLASLGLTGGAPPPQTPPPPPPASS